MMQPRRSRRTPAFEEHKSGRSSAGPPLFALRPRPVARPQVRVHYVDRLERADHHLDNVCSGFRRR